MLSVCFYSKMICRELYGGFKLTNNHVCHDFDVELVHLPAQMLSLIAEILRQQAIVLPIHHLQKKLCIVLIKL